MTIALSTARRRLASPRTWSRCSRICAGRCCEDPPGAEPHDPGGRAMSEVRVPDIGDFTDVPVIEIHVSAGDTVAVEDPLVTLESDKATMDVPAPEAGVIAQLQVKIGDRVSEGSVLMTLQSDTDGAAAPASEAPAASAPAPAAAPGAASASAPAAAGTAVLDEPAPPPPT